MKFSFTSMECNYGKRMKNEDEVIGNEEFIGVFDGHSAPYDLHFNPHSRYLKNNLFSLVKDKLGDKTETESYKTALKEALVQIDATLEEKAKGKGYLGSTACVVWCHQHQSALLTGNVGDSRAVLSRQGIAVDLTRDHRPNDPDEEARIKGVGGYVSWDGPSDDDDKPKEGWQRLMDYATWEPYFVKGLWRTNGKLGLSRSIGTTEKPHVSAEGDVEVHTLQEGDEFVIVGTDGLWDGLTSQEVVSLVHKFIADGVDKTTIPHSIICHLIHIERHVDNCGIVIGWLSSDDISGKKRNENSSNQEEKRSCPNKKMKYSGDSTVAEGKTDHDNKETQE